MKRVFQSPQIMKVATVGLLVMMCVASGFKNNKGRRYDFFPIAKNTTIEKPPVYLM